MCLFKMPHWIQCSQVACMAMLISVMLASFQLLALAQRKDHPVEHPTLYRAVQIDGLSIFYREAGPKNAPTLLLLHGLPSSSRMFEPLFARLSDRYHLVAPDYPGFGHSDWPDPKLFAYTFDHIAEIMNYPQKCVKVRFLVAGPLKIARASAARLANCANFARTEFRVTGVSRSSSGRL